jgi:amino acid permease
MISEANWTADYKVTMFLSRFIAVGALASTVVACTLILVQSLLDYQAGEEVVYPEPTMLGTFKAFGSIMFAYAGASTFPTIQADMKKKEKFNISAVSACVSKWSSVVHVLMSFLAQVHSIKSC